MTCVDSLCRPDAGFARRGATPPATWDALRDWAENLGILVRYALGLDLYDRGDVAVCSAPPSREPASRP